MFLIQRDLFASILGVVLVMSFPDIGHAQEITEDHFAQPSIDQIELEVVDYRDFQIHPSCAKAYCIINSPNKLFRKPGKRSGDLVEFDLNALKAIPRIRGEKIESSSFIYDGMQTVLIDSVLYTVSDNEITPVHTIWPNGSGKIHKMSKRTYLQQDSTISLMDSVGSLKPIFNMGEKDRLTIIGEHGDWLVTETLIRKLRNKNSHYWSAMNDYRFYNVFEEASGETVYSLKVELVDTTVYQYFPKKIKDNLLGLTMKIWKGGAWSYDLIMYDLLTGKQKRIDGGAVPIRIVDILGPMKMVYSIDIEQTRSYYYTDFTTINAKMYDLELGNLDRRLPHIQVADDLSRMILITNPISKVALERYQRKMHFAVISFGDKTDHPRKLPLTEEESCLALKHIVTRMTGSASLCIPFLGSAITELDKALGAKDHPALRGYLSKVHSNLVPTIDPLSDLWLTQTQSKMAESGTCPCGKKIAKALKKANGDSRRSWSDVSLMTRIIKVISERRGEYESGLERDKETLSEYLDQLKGAISITRKTKNELEALILNCP